MSNRPPARFLEELGWLAVRWSGLEVLVETSCAYLFKAGLAKARDNQPPKPFGARIKFIRRSLSHPAFVHLQPEYEAALVDAVELSNKRNELMHGAFTSWSSGAIRQTVIKSHDSGYVAFQGIPVSEADLANLSERIGVAFATHFNLQDRMKCIIRAYEGFSDIARRATFHG